MQRPAYAILTALFMSCASAPKQVQALPVSNDVSINLTQLENGISSNLPYDPMDIGLNRTNELFTKNVLENSYKAPVYIVLHSESRDADYVQDIEDIFKNTFKDDPALLFKTNNLTNLHVHLAARSYIEGLKLPAILFYKQGTVVDMLPSFTNHNPPANSTVGKFFTKTKNLSDAVIIRAIEDTLQNNPQ